MNVYYIFFIFLLILLKIDLHNDVATTQKVMAQTQWNSSDCLINSINQSKNFKIFDKYFVKIVSFWRHATQILVISAPKNVRFFKISAPDKSGAKHQLSNMADIESEKTSNWYRYHYQTARRPIQLSLLIN